MSIFAIPFPAIDPIAFSVGPVAVRWYGLAYMAGLLLGWLYARQLVSTDRFWGNIPRPSADKLDDLLLMVAIGIVVGGRIGEVVFYNLPYYLANPSEILKIWQGGMSFHGGLLGAIVAGIIFARRTGVFALSILDIMAMVVPIGLFFGRIANFINGELWGRTTDVPWAVIFPEAGPEPRHPSQLYEAALEGAVLMVVMFVAVRLWGFRRPGLLGALFIFGYGLARFSVEFFREPDEQLGFLFGGWLTMGMVLSIPMMIIGALVFTQKIAGRDSDASRR